MTFEEAKKLKVGDKVCCPAPHGGPALTGIVTYVPPDPDKEVNTNLSGAQYIWILVKHPSGHNQNWPSNRLS